MLMRSLSSILAAFFLFSSAIAGYEYFDVFFYPGDNYTQSLDAFQNLLGISERFSHSKGKWNTVHNYDNEELEFHGSSRNGTSVRRWNPSQQPFWKLLQSPGVEGACRVDAETGEKLQCITHGDQNSHEKQEQDRRQRELEEKRGSVEHFNDEHPGAPRWPVFIPPGGTRDLRPPVDDPVPQRLFVHIVPKILNPALVRQTEEYLKRYREQ